MYQSFRGGSNAQVPGVETEVEIIRVCGGRYRERMRLTNYCEYEATRVYPPAVPIISFLYVALYREIGTQRKFTTIRD